MGAVGGREEEGRRDEAAVGKECLWRGEPLFRGGETESTRWWWEAVRRGR
jgi:hypothetical protein